MVLILALLLSSTGRCSSDLPRAGFELARVANPAGGRAYFYSDEGGCPTGPEARCRRKAYLVAGDPVLAWSRSDGFACVTFVARSKGRATTGWLREADLAPSESPRAVSLDAWAGAWDSEGADLEVALAQDGAVRVKGYAFWDGGNGNVHTGEVEEEGRPHGATLSLGAEDASAQRTVSNERRGIHSRGAEDASAQRTVSNERRGIHSRGAEDASAQRTVSNERRGIHSRGAEDACSLKLTLADPFIVAEDNQACGGLNVTFTGVYRRRQPQR